MEMRGFSDLFTEVVEELGTIINDALLGVFQHFGRKGGDETSRPSGNKHVSDLFEIAVTSLCFKIAFKISSLNFVNEVFGEQFISKDGMADFHVDFGRFKYFPVAERFTCIFLRSGFICSAGFSGGSFGF